VFREASPLTLVALASWVVTAALGGNLLLRGKAYLLLLFTVSDRPVSSRRPPMVQPPMVRAALMGLHLLLAVSGLIFWIGYSMFDRRVLAYGALTLLGAVALLGVGVVDRWRNGAGRHARPGGHGAVFPSGRPRST
jgi:hypothetical protein